MRFPALALVLACGIAASLPFLPVMAQTPQHAVTLGDAPKYPAGFKQLDYVNVNAPKGGELRLSTPSGFDSLNPFIPRGDEAPGLGMLYETLMTQTPDDDLSEYGLIAESAEIAEDHTWVAFNLRAEAKWAEGKPITAEDVVFTYDRVPKVTEQTRRRSRCTWARWPRPKRWIPMTLRITTKEVAPNLLVNLAQLPIMSKKAASGPAAEGKTTTELNSGDGLIGTGPYKFRVVESAAPNSCWRAIENYWGKKPVWDKVIYRRSAMPRRAWRPCWPATSTWAMRARCCRWTRPPRSRPRTRSRPGSSRCARPSRWSRS